MEGSSGGDFGESPGAAPRALRAVALEAQHMVTVGPDPSAILNPGFPLEARLAGATGDLRLMRGGERHGDPP
jgi:hypothetical protein